MPFETLPPPMVVAVVATVVWGIVAMVLGLPLIRAWTRRMERRHVEHMPSDVGARLERIESAVEAIAIEVERISESQRYLTKLQSGEKLPAGAADLKR